MKLAPNSASLPALKLTGLYAALFIAVSSFNAVTAAAAFARQPPQEKAKSVPEGKAIESETKQSNLKKVQEKQTDKQPESAGVHRLTSTNRSKYDAFAYVNRIPEKPYDDETAEDFAGRIMGRLANLEGRILLKAPKGMDQLAYNGFKTFLRYEGKESVGNCAACHTPAGFSDGKSHAVTIGSDQAAKPIASPTPSLRNLVSREVDIRAALLKKLETSAKKRAGNAKNVSDAYAAMTLNEKDIPGIVAFLKLLEDVPDAQFRKLILDAKLLDTTTGSNK
jgi:mono/diheme cytochrome c family protein